MAGMQAASHYSLHRDDAAQDTSQLLRSGTRLALQIEGVLLESQWQLADGRALLLLTDDSPYDEMLHIYLLDAQGLQVLDALEAGSPTGLGGAGVLSILRHGDTWLELAFFKGRAGFRIVLICTQALLASDFIKAGVSNDFAFSSLSSAKSHGNLSPKCLCHFGHASF